MWFLGWVEPYGENDGCHGLYFKTKEMLLRYVLENGITNYLMEEVEE